MMTPRQYEVPVTVDEGDSGNKVGKNKVLSSSHVAQGSSPATAKARQAQRRYRSLFHQACREYQGWCQGEEDSQRALGSVCHLLDRLRMLEPGHEQNVDDGVLGGLAHLPGCRELLIRKHFVELERVMRLCRALVQQMKNQVSRVEEALAEAWQIHRSEARFQLPPRALNVEGSQEVPCRGPQSTPLVRRQLGDFEVISTPGSSSVSSQVWNKLPTNRQQDTPGKESRNNAVRPALDTRTTPGGGITAVVATTGPAEYLQWLGNLSSMLVHEQWRKEELLTKVDFSLEESASKHRTYVQEHWSSRSSDSFLHRVLMDRMLVSAHVVPLSSTS